MDGMDGWVGGPVDGTTRRASLRSMNIDRSSRSASRLVPLRNRAGKKRKKLEPRNWRLDRELREMPCPPQNWAGPLSSCSDGASVLCSSGTQSDSTRVLDWASGRARDGSQSCSKRSLVLGHELRWRT